MIWTAVDEYFIEPVLDHVMNSSRAHPHVIYKRSAIPGGDEPFLRIAKNMIQNEEERARPITENLCGVTGNLCYTYVMIHAMQRYVTTHSNCTVNQNISHNPLRVQHC